MQAFGWRRFFCIDSAYDAFSGTGSDHGEYLLYTIVRFYRRQNPEALFGIVASVRG
jgi:hypothetical protein